MLLRSVPLILSFDAWLFADLYLRYPALIIVGEKAESRWHSEKIFELLEGKNQNAKMIVVPEGRHMDFYDNDDYINPAVKNIAEFFAAYV